MQSCQLTNPNEHVDESSDEGYSSDDNLAGFKSALYERLDQVKPAGSFATAGQCSTISRPALDVKGHGLVSLPLTENTAKAIVDVCHRAPFGKGSETIVDESVRKTWELDPTNFRFGNPDWHSSVQSIAYTAAHELGYAEDASIKAELYKLLLYEEGAMFKAHQDTEKSDGMFGTLVISLPSEHEGGDIKVSHHGVTKTFTTAAQSAYRYQYIAWYADVVHEVRPVTSGYRLVVVYNLVQTSPGTTQSAATIFGESIKLSKMLAAWHRGVKKRNVSAPAFLAYILDHEYTEASLNIDSLKGLDKVKVDCLVQSCSQSDVGIYLASCENMQSGSCEYSKGIQRRQQYHTIKDLNYSSLQLKCMVAVDGTLLAKGVDLSEDDLVQENVFDRAPDKEKYEGYMGNSGPDATHFYQDTVVILVPFTSRRRWLQDEVNRQNVDINTWMQRLCRPQTGGTSSYSRKDLFHLSKLAIHCRLADRQSLWRNGNRSGNFPAAEAKWPIKAAVMVGGKDSFALSIRTAFPISSEAFIEIGKGLWHLNLDSEAFWPSICALFDRRKTFHETFNDTQSLITGFGRGLRAKTRLQQNPGNEEEDRPISLRSWTLSYMLRRLEVLQPVSREDGIGIAQLATAYDNKGLMPSLILIVKRQHDDFAMRLAFIAHILSTYNDETIEDKGARPGLNRLIEVTCRRFVVQCQQTGTKRDRSGAEISSTVECFSNSEDVALILHYLSESEDWFDHDRLLDRLSLSAESVHTFAFPAFFLPLLATLVTRLQSFPDHMSRYKELFRTVLKSYRLRYIQSKPPGSDWARSSEGCRERYCYDCKKLDIFLLDPTEEIERFAVSNSNRAHLHQQLDSTRHSHVTDRSGTLVVKKAQSALHKASVDWEVRVAEREKALGAMDQDILKELLEEEFHNYFLA